MTTAIFGSAVHRVEDPRFPTGASRHVDDLPVEGAARAWFVRSIMAHARIVGVEASHLGVRPLDPPFSPERVWRAIQEAIG